MFFKFFSKNQPQQNFTYSTYPQQPLQPTMYPMNNYRRVTALDSLSHASLRMTSQRTKPVTYSATIDTLSSPNVHYQPTPQSIRRIPEPYQRQPYQQYCPSPSYPVPPYLLPTQTKRSFQMPHAVSLGVAFGLFFLGIVSWLM